MMRGGIKVFILCVAALSFDGSLVVTEASATAPMANSQAPGFYRMMLGDFEITALNDDVVSQPITLPGTSAGQIKRRIAEDFVADPYDMSSNAFLINTGSKLVLIDAGIGSITSRMNPKNAGRLIANLKAAGYEPAQVDEVYITHAHLDHVGGLVIGPDRAFPNAMLRMAKSEFDDCTKPLSTDETKDPRKAGLQRLMRLLIDPYVNAGKFATFDGDTSLVPGIRALGTHGHTAGHTSYVVESRGRGLIVLGDIVHVGAVQFANPRAHFASDAAPKAAIQERNRIFKFAADHGHWLAGAHVSFPGLGHIRPVAGGYRWTPVNYSEPD